VKSKVELPAGTLSLEVARSDYSLEHLCGFASRANAKRGFLFVSKVLGKHIPVKPSSMTEIHSKLAAKILEVLGGQNAAPVLCIALAETATGLGQSVYEHLLEQDAALKGQSMFVHSSRYRVSTHNILGFEESHSHASDHLIHIPDGGLERSIFSSAKTLILIDDEMSTGSTFLNLARAYQTQNPGLERIVLVTLTDWAGGERRRELLAQMPAPTHPVSVLEGQYQWTVNPDFVLAPTRAAHGNGEAKDALLERNFARLGVLENPRVDFREILKPTGLLERYGKVGFPPPYPLNILVLGTGEFSYLPFKFAQWLEWEGQKVHFQSTTRSPIVLGGAIRTKLEFPDHYGDDIPNYVYNLEPHDYDLIFVCLETPLDLSHPLLELTKAIPVFF